MKDSERKTYCRNCNYPILRSAKYCPQCSQKNTNGKVTVWEFLQDFFTNLFNIDSKLFLTFFALFTPGKLTVEYFRGKHKSYASPVRLFLYAGITLFAVVITKTQDADFGGGKIQYAKSAERIRVKRLFENNILRFDTTFLDTSEYHTTDSLSKWINQAIGVNSADSMYVNNMFGDKDRVNISMADIANLSIDSILQKYEIPSGMKSMIVQQQIKTMRDGKGLFHFFIGKLPIFMFLMMPFLALILKVIYARHNYYFVEHLVFSFHYHTFAFLATLLLVLLGKYFNGWIIAAVIISIFIYQFMAMRRYYDQGFFKTFLKFSLLNFLYLFLVIFFFTGALMLSFLLF